MADGGDGVAELAVDAAAVVELLVGVAGRALVLDAADAADSHDEDDEHEDEGHAQRADDDVERVAGHVGQRVVGGVRRLPLQVCRHTHVSHTRQSHGNNDNSCQTFGHALCRQGFSFIMTTVDVVDSHRSHRDYE